MCQRQQSSRRRVQSAGGASADQVITIWLIGWLANLVIGPAATKDSIAVASMWEALIEALRAI